MQFSCLSKKILFSAVLCFVFSQSCNGCDYLKDYTEIKDKSEYKRNIDNDVTFIVFQSPTCPHCNKVKPVLKKLRDKFIQNKKVTFLNVNISNLNKENLAFFTKTFNFYQVPYFVILKQGNVVEIYDSARENERSVINFENSIKKALELDINAIDK